MEETALMMAAFQIQCDNLDFVKLLLDKGADPNIRDKNGETALSAAAESGCTPIVELLKAHGAKG